MGSRLSGGKDKPRRDRTGEVYAGLEVVGQAPRVGNELTWSCRCLACGSIFAVVSRQMARYERKGHGCGCRALTHVPTRRRVAA